MILLSLGFSLRVMVHRKVLKDSDRRLRSISGSVNGAIGDRDNEDVGDRWVSEGEMTTVSQK